VYTGTCSGGSFLEGASDRASWLKDRRTSPARSALPSNPPIPDFAHIAIEIDHDAHGALLIPSYITASVSSRISVMNMYPGEWEIIRGGFDLSATAWGVTPHAQKTGTSSFLISTGSP
jgi:hypothetical protein